MQPARQEKSGGLLTRAEFLSGFYKTDKLLDMIHVDEAYRSVSKRTADMVSIVTNSKLDYGKGKERIDMCEAIEGIRNDALAKGLVQGRAEGRKEGRAEGRAEGRKEGRAEGRKEGRAEGRKEGRAEGRAEGRYETLIALVRSGDLNIGAAASFAGITVADFQKLMDTEDA